MRFRLSGGLVAERSRKDDLCVLSRLERELMNVESQGIKKVFVEDVREELEYGFWVDFCVFDYVSNRNTTNWGCPCWRNIGTIEQRNVSDTRRPLQSDFHLLQIQREPFL